MAADGAPAAAPACGRHAGGARCRRPSSAGRLAHLLTTAQLCCDSAAALAKLRTHEHATTPAGAAGVHTMTAASHWGTLHVLLHAALLLLAARALAPAGAQRAAMTSGACPHCELFSLLCCWAICSWGRRVAVGLAGLLHQLHVTRLLATVEPNCCACLSAMYVAEKLMRPSGLATSLQYPQPCPPSHRHCRSCPCCGGWACHCRSPAHCLPTGQHPTAC